MNRYTIYRDTSEKSGYGWLFPANDFCEGTESFNLFTGDYSIKGLYEEKIFVIERKGSVGEFVGNISHKEKWDDFKQELDRLEQFKWPYLICEFPFSQIERFPVGSNVPKSVWPKLRVKPEFLIKRTLEISLAFKTKLIFADSGGFKIASSLFKRVIERHEKERQ